ncbi:cytosine deaminase [Apiospora marii]|uniref:Cytosine deaminase n=1 Tax=Apiospora marii TaxID=335849 RepID=A0ABR1RUM9_9PEZI
MKLQNVILADEPSGSRWDLEVSDGRLQTKEATKADPEAPSSLLLPPLCHPHIHLDKSYLLTCNHAPSGPHPDYTDLVPQSGSFGEALANTSRAKERYTSEDLYLRGSQLLATSYQQGVTSMRAFVELDHVAGTLPLQAAIRLQQDFSHLVQVQICAFAQDPVFSTGHGEENRATVEKALREFGPFIDALGSAPYVEQCEDEAIKNIDWAIRTALEHGLHLDFHLDYNLDGSAAFLLDPVIALLGDHQWSRRAEKSKTIAIGHCSHLTTLPTRKILDVANTIRRQDLPVHFVGLPTSDLFMMGRPGEKETRPHSRPRGTLQVPSMIKDFGLSACLGTNNVGNAFTPYGTGDPLQLACWGVGLFQAGTVDDAELLFASVSSGAREAIGLPNVGYGERMEKGSAWRPMLLIKNMATTRVPSKAGHVECRIPARQRLSIKDVVWDPPETSLRSVVG